VDVSLRLADLSLAEVRELIAAPEGVGDASGRWTSWTGEARAFGSPAFPYVGLRREDPWCDLRIYHAPPADSWVTIMVRSDWEGNGEFPEGTTSGEMLAVCQDLMLRSVDGAEPIFPRIIRVGRFRMGLEQWVVKHPRAPD
jgi:hypothetical protein